MMEEPNGRRYWYIDKNTEKWYIRSDAPEWAKKEFEEYFAEPNPDENGIIEI